MLVTLLERMTKFAEVRELNRQRYVDRYATPTFKAAELVYKDYSDLLCQTKKKILRLRTTGPLLQFLEERRLRQLAERDLLRAVITRIPTERWTNFERGILGLMHGCVSTFEKRVSIAPVGINFDEHTVYDIVRNIEHSSGAPLPQVRANLLERVNLQIEKLDEAWKSVCAGYADLTSLAIPVVKTPSTAQQKTSGLDS